MDTWPAALRLRDINAVLPFNLLTHIFSYLPDDSKLYRHRRVCKTWKQYVVSAQRVLDLSTLAGWLNAAGSPPLQALLAAFGPALSSIETGKDVAAANTIFGQGKLLSEVLRGRETALTALDVSGLALAPEALPTLSHFTNLTQLLAKDGKLASEAFQQLCASLPKIRSLEFNLDSNYSQSMATMTQLESLAFHSACDRSLPVLWNSSLASFTNLARLQVPSNFDLDARTMFFIGKNLQWLEARRLVPSADRKFSNLCPNLRTLITTPLSPLLVEIGGLQKLEVLTIVPSHDYVATLLQVVKLRHLRSLKTIIFDQVALSEEQARELPATVRSLGLPGPDKSQLEALLALIKKQMPLLQTLRLGVAGYRRTEADVVAAKFPLLRELHLYGVDHLHHAELFFPLIHITSLDLLVLDDKVHGAEVLRAAAQTMKITTQHALRKGFPPQALQLARNGKVAEAEHLMQTALAFSPGSDILWRDYALVIAASIPRASEATALTEPFSPEELLRLTRYEDAARRVIDVFEVVGPRLAVVLTKLGRDPEAQALLEAAIAKSASSHPNYTYVEALVLIYIRQLDFAKAIPLLKAAASHIYLESELMELYLGRCYIELGQLEEAYEALRFVALKPGVELFEEIRVKLGRAPVVYGDVTPLEGPDDPSRVFFARANSTPDMRITPNGLTLTNLKASFETARATLGVAQGKWYWEVTINTPKLMQIGIATQESAAQNSTMGVGDDAHSYCVDFYRRVTFHCSASKPYGNNLPAWKAGTVVGFYLDLPERSLTCSLDGYLLEAAFFNLVLPPGQCFFPAISVDRGQSATFNFGASPFKHFDPSRTPDFKPYSTCAPVSGPLSLFPPTVVKVRALPIGPPSVAHQNFLQIHDHQFTNDEIFFEFVQDEIIGEICSRLSGVKDALAVLATCRRFNSILSLRHEFWRRMFDKKWRSRFYRVPDLPLQHLRVSTNLPASSLRQWKFHALQLYYRSFSSGSISQYGSMMCNGVYPGPGFRSKPYHEEFVSVPFPQLFKAPVFTDGNRFIGRIGAVRSRNLYCYSPGGEVWRIVDPTAFPIAVDPANQVVYVSIVNSIAKIDTATGKELCPRLDVGGNLGGGFRGIIDPQAKTLYAVLSGAKVICVDLKHFSLRWQQETVPNSGGGVSMSKTGLIVVATKNVFALNPNTGAVEWTFDKAYPAQSVPACDPVTGYMVMGTNKGIIQIFDGQNGQAVHFVRDFRYRTEIAGLSAAVIHPSNGRAYVQWVSGAITSVHIATGKVVAHEKAPLGSTKNFSKMLQLNCDSAGRLYCMSVDFLLCFDEDFNLLWEFSFRDRCRNFVWMDGNHLVLAGLTSTAILQAEPPYSIVII